MIQLGITAVDQVTGFRGVVTGLVEYLTGCNQALLIPKVDKDGKTVDGAWFDVQRLLPDSSVPRIETNNTRGAGSDLAPPKR